MGWVCMHVFARVSANACACVRPFVRACMHNVFAIYNNI